MGANASAVSAPTPLSPSPSSPTSFFPPSKQLSRWIERVTFTGENPVNTTPDKTPATAVVLLSGGLDSTTVLAIAGNEGFDIHALSFRYGQRHAVEIAAARRIARKARVCEHHIVDIDLAQFGGSALTGDIPVPKDRDLTANATTATEIPVTYVPARNTIFLSYAIGLAEVIGAADIFIGVNALDYSGYPDCRPEYIQAFERMANLATRAGVEGATRLRVRTPLI